MVLIVLQAKDFVCDLRRIRAVVGHQDDGAVRLAPDLFQPASDPRFEFLIQAGEILESQGKKAEALELYKHVKEKYFNSMQYQTIDKYIERVSE